MSKLRPNAKKQIYETLDQTHFTQYDFDILFGDEILESEIGADREKSIFKITFLLNPEFTYSAIRAKEASDPQNLFQTIETPGEYFYEASIWSHRNFNGCLRHIKEWVQRILDDYRSSSPIFDEFEDLRESLRKEMDEHIKDPSAHFSNEEISDLSSKIDDISSRFDEQKEKYDIAEIELSKIKTELSGMKDNLSFFTKGAWYKTALNKVFSVCTRFASSKDGQKLAETTVRGFLTGGIE